MCNNYQYGMTDLMTDYAQNGNLTIEEAKSLLHDNAYLRTANETLAKYCRITEDDLPTLSKKISTLLFDSDPSQKKGIY